MTSEKIKSIAMDLFGRYGYEETSLVDIATGVGIKKPSIYNHFKNKEELFLTILDDVLTTEINAFRSIIKQTIDEPTVVKIYSIFTHFLHRYSESAEGLFWKRTIFFPPESFKQTINKKLLEFEQKTSDELEAIFTEGIDKGDIKELDTSLLIAAFYCLLDGLFVEQHYYDPEELKLRLESSWTVFWLGIKK